MNEACRPFREQLGSLALGHLDGSDSAAVGAHLDGCADCRAEFRALREVADVLPLADPERVTDAVAPPPGLADRVISLVREERRLAERRRAERRRGRAIVGAAAAAATLAIVIAALVVAGPERPALAVTLDPSVPRATAPIDATLTERPWGTEIRLEVRGLPEGEAYVVWLRDPSDERHAAGSFTAISDGKVVLASSLPLGDAAGIGISDGAGETMLYGHLPDDRGDDPANDPGVDPANDAANQ